MCVGGAVSPTSISWWDRQDHFPAPTCPLRRRRAEGRSRMARRATALRREASLTALSTARSCRQDGPCGMSGRLFDVIDQHAGGIIAAKTARTAEDRISAVVIVPHPHMRFDKVWAQRAGRYLQPVTVEYHR